MLVNVGSIGLNKFDYDNQIISGAYVVFGTKEDELLPEYLEILIKDKHFKDYVSVKANVGNGVRMNFTFEDMCEWEIPLPSIEEQNKILSTGRRYVDMINSIDTICKNIKYSDFCEIQSGDLYKIGNILSLEYGKSLTESERNEGKIPVYGSNGVIGYHDKSLVKDKGIIVGRKGSAGKVCWTDKEFWVIDTAFYVNVKVDNIDLKYLYYLLNDLNLESLVIDAVKPGINRNDVYNINVNVPQKETQLRIVEKLNSIHEYIQNTIRTKEKYQKELNKILKDLWGEEE